MKLKTIIITGANEKYAGLLTQLIKSLKQWDDPVSDAIGVFDLGLSKGTLAKLAGDVDYFVNPQWDVDVSEFIKTNKPFERASIARFFLKEYFPGYDLYLWLDADTWVQEKKIINWYYKGALESGMALTPSQDRSFKYTSVSLAWRVRHLKKYFGKPAVDMYFAALTHQMHYQYYNSGAFCITVDAPHWSVWKKYFELAAPHFEGNISDQAVLNYAIWNENLPVHPLPALCNWPCHFSVPLWDSQRKKFCEPLVPYRPIGLIHMTGKSKDYKITINIDGSEHDTNLWFYQSR